MNLQQIPSGEWRHFFISQLGKKLVSSDYTSQEIYQLAVISKNETMLDFFNNPDDVFKGDFHSFSATRMFRVIRQDPDLIINKKDHAQERNISKSATFKISYG